MRTLARECVFKYLFSKLFNSDDEGLFNVLIKDLNKDDKDFASKLLKAEEENEVDFLNRISELSIYYKIERIHSADKVALLIGMAELSAFKETPIPVVINEAVDLTAKYSGETSTNFVNGILGEYVKKYN